MTDNDSSFYKLPGVKLTVPVVQATLGCCDGPRLAAAISEAGGLGTLSFQKTTCEEAQITLNDLQKRTQKPILLSLLSDFEQPGVIDLLLRKHIRHFQVQWWNGARLARYYARPMLLSTGKWGHFNRQKRQFRTSPMPSYFRNRIGWPGAYLLPHTNLLALIRQQYPEMPLIAGGGLATAKDVEEMLTLGANAALMGTRFLLSEESQADLAAKNLLRSATCANLILDTELRGDWPCAPRRRFSNALGMPDASDYSNDFNEYSAGLGIDQMSDILSASQIVANLCPKKLF